MLLLFKNLHSYFAFLVLSILVISFAYALIGYTKKQEFTKRFRSLIFFSLMGIHSQFIFGLVLYFLSPLGVSNLNGATMKDTVSRLYALEHPIIMILAIAIITIGYSKSNKAKANQSKYKYIIVSYGIGLALIISRIPWFAWIA